MKIIYSEALRQSGDLFALAQRASQVLEDVATRSAPRVTAEWDRDPEENGGNFVRLRLSDWIGSVTARLSRAELSSDEDALVGRLNRLWGDMLEIRLDRLLDQFDKSLGIPAGS